MKTQVTKLDFTGHIRTDKPFLLYELVQKTISNLTMK